MTLNEKIMSLPRWKRTLIGYSVSSLFPISLISVLIIAFINPQNIFITFPLLIIAFIGMLGVFWADIIDAPARKATIVTNWLELRRKPFIIGIYKGEIIAGSYVIYPDNK